MSDNIFSIYFNNELSYNEVKNTIFYDCSKNNLTQNLFFDFDDKNRKIGFKLNFTITATIFSDTEIEKKLGWKKENGELTSTHEFYTNNFKSDLHFNVEINFDLFHRQKNEAIQILKKAPKEQEGTLENVTMSVFKHSNDLFSYLTVRNKNFTIGDWQHNDSTGIEVLCNKENLAKLAKNKCPILMEHLPEELQPLLNESFKNGKIDSNLKRYIDKANGHFIPKLDKLIELASENGVRIIGFEKGFSLDAAAIHKINKPESTLLQQCSERALFMNALALKKNTTTQQLWN